MLVLAVGAALMVVLKVALVLMDLGCCCGRLRRQLS
jgi:hypothetical protein